MKNIWEREGVGESWVKWNKLGFDSCGGFGYGFSSSTAARCVAVNQQYSNRILATVRVTKAKTVEVQTGEKDNVFGFSLKSAWWLRNNRESDITVTKFLIACNLIHHRMKRQAQRDEKNREVADRSDTTSNHIELSNIRESDSGHTNMIVVSNDSEPQPKYSNILRLSLSTWLDTWHVVAVNIEMQFLYIQF